MKKRIFAILLCLCAIMSTSAIAYYESEPIDIDPLNNDLFQIVSELSEEEYYNISNSLYHDDYSLNTDSPYLHLFSDLRDNEAYPYNDGLKKDYYNYEEMDYVFSVSGLFDVSGNLVYSNPVMETSAMAGGYTHNLGYIKDTVVYFNENITALTTFTNVYTGDAYCFFVDDNESTPLLNDGSFYFKYNGKFYHATLKKPAIITVTYNGSKIYFDQLPVIDNGRTLVPLRAIFETLGATVEWNGDTQTVTATKDDVSISLVINNTTATKNGEAITLDVPAKIVNGRTLVPVRFIADCFGVHVDWNGDLQKVILTK